MVPAGHHLQSWVSMARCFSSSTTSPLSWRLEINWKSKALTLAAKIQGWRAVKDQNAYGTLELWLNSITHLGREVSGLCSCSSLDPWYKVKVKIKSSSHQVIQLNLGIAVCGLLLPPRLCLKGDSSNSGSRAASERKSHKTPDMMIYVFIHYIDLYNNYSDLSVCIYI